MPALLSLAGVIKKRVTKAILVPAVKDGESRSRLIGFVHQRTKLYLQKTTFYNGLHCGNAMSQVYASARSLVNSIAIFNKPMFWQNGYWGDYGVWRARKDGEG